MNINFPLDTADAMQLKSYDATHRTNLFVLFKDLKAIMDKNTRSIHTIIRNLSSPTDITKEYSTFASTLEATFRFYLEITETYNEDDVTLPIFRKISDNIAKRIFFRDILSFNMLVISDSGDISHLEENVSRLTKILSSFT